MLHSPEGAQMLIGITVAHHLLLSETYAEKNQISRATSFIPSRALEILLFMTATTIQLSASFSTLSFATPKAFYIKL